MCALTGVLHCLPLGISSLPSLLCPLKLVLLQAFAYFKETEAN